MLRDVVKGFLNHAEAAHPDGAVQFPGDVVTGTFNRDSSRLGELTAFHAHGLRETQVLQLRRMEFVSQPAYSGGNRLRPGTELRDTCMCLPWLVGDGFSSPLQLHCEYRQFLADVVV